LTRKRAGSFSSPVIPAQANRQCYLIDRHPLVAAYHLCNFNMKDSFDPFIFVRSIAAQFATQLEGYRSALKAVELERIAEEDPGTLLRRLIADSLKGENPDKPVLLLVDALDEAWQAGERSIVKVLHERLYRPSSLDQAGAILPQGASHTRPLQEVSPP